MTELSHCRHIVNKENVGPANIRNQLAREARFSWILFIDCDAKVETADFLATYYQQMGKADVVAGGLLHQKENHDPHRSLRFKYEKDADLHRSAAERNLNPYDKFTPFNVMMRRSTFLCILFDKDCREYGYEDALFGVELKKRGISILHIDNPLIHIGKGWNSTAMWGERTVCFSGSVPHGCFNAPTKSLAPRFAATSFPLTHPSSSSPFTNSATTAS